LDIKQRIHAAQAIRSISSCENYVIVVEHDLSVLEFMCDHAHIFYGEPSAYGVCTTPTGIREGVNIFLRGFVPTENLRFREEELVFQISDDAVSVTEDSKNSSKAVQYNYPYLTKQLGDFKLEVYPGTFKDSEIVVLLGENGTGKTTFIRLLAGLISPDNEAKLDFDKMKISYKPQIIKLKPTSSITVRQLLNKKTNGMWTNPQFMSDVIKPLNIINFIDQLLNELSGGELQRVTLAVCLGQNADLYLIDEPSSSLDSEQRLITAKVIKRYIMHIKKPAFVVEHDLIMATYMANRVIAYQGKPGIIATATSPSNVAGGLSKFLQQMEISMRTEPRSKRPKINKPNSRKDKIQKKRGDYFLVNYDPKYFL